MPEYPDKHVHRYPVDPLAMHDPLFRHGEGEQMLTEIRKMLSACSSSIVVEVVRFNHFELLKVLDGLFRDLSR